MRCALPPEVLADAQQDVVHDDNGAVRAGRGVKSLSGLPREERILASVLLNLQELKELGYLRGPSYLTEAGRKAAEADRDRGFAPTEEELRSVMGWLRRSGKIRAEGEH